MTDEVVTTLAWAGVLISGIYSFTIYILVRFLTTGRRLFERRPQDEDPRIGGGGR